MNKKTILSLAFLIIAPLILYVVWPSDENRIKKLFREGAKAIEQEKREDVMAKVSFTYRDEKGLSYIMIKEMISRIFGQMSDINIEYRITHITVDDTQATAELDLRVIVRSGQETGYAVGDAAEPAHMKFFLEKERARWLVIRTEGIPLPY